MLPPNKKIRILSDIKLNSPNVSKTSQDDQRDSNQICETLDKIINYERKRNLSSLELENILCKDKN